MRRKTSGAVLILCSLIMLMWVAGCSSDTDNPLHTEGTPEIGDPTSFTSPVFPYGHQYQLHANSRSVNTAPPFSTYLMEPIGNTAGGNSFQIPSIAKADDFTTAIYFDSRAVDDGDGSMEHPYNTLSIIEEQDYPDDCALLLKAGSVFYVSALNAASDKKDIYFGSYGQGDMPIVANVDDFTSPSQFKTGSSFSGENVTVNGLHFVGGGTGMYDRLMNIGGTNLTIANCHIESIFTPGSGYLFNIFKGGAQNMVLYHNEIAFARDDIWYASSRFSYTIVSNYFHHSNMGIFGAENFDPQNRETWGSKGGDIIQFEYEGLDGAYIANNFFDKGDSAGKFALIFNGGQGNSNIIVEYNTFIGPNHAFGGAALQWHTRGILRHNLILNTDPQGGVSGLASYPEYSSQISENDFVGYTQNSACYNLSFSDLAEGNRVFAGLQRYREEVGVAERKGSSIFSGI